MDPLPNDKFFDRSILKAFADRKINVTYKQKFFLEWVENIVGYKPFENTVAKGEIARYEQFFLFPQCFQKACFPGASKRVIVWERVKMAPKYRLLSCRVLRPTNQAFLVPESRDFFFEDFLNLTVIQLLFG